LKSLSLSWKDLKKWHIESRDLYLILISKGWTKEKSNLTDEKLAWAWLNKHYPAIAKWLAPFESKAKKRTDKGDFWWELRACAYYKEFEKPKIIYPDMFRKGRFVFDNKGYFFSNTVYFIPYKDSFALGILNSNVIWLLLKGKTTFLFGGTIRLFSQYVETVPIPSASDSEKAEIGKLAEKCQKIAELRYQKQESVRRRIPDLCPPKRPAKLNTKLKNWWTLEFKDFRKEVKKSFKAEIPLSERNDWENWLTAEKTAISELTQQLQQLEHELNQKVYALFDLTEEEVKLVEANI